MSQKRKKPSAEFKTKVVLEVIEGDQTLNQICSKYELVGTVAKSYREFQKGYFLVLATLELSS
ncbi:hypothetical protein AVI51_07720 [Piscirickettsia salmonis]|uniref:Uncharacterized protein n=1 Tax=Piscirickettsia salmonis TaxID=1238 RepID=A0A9Q6LNM1_PISSA|nr:transposase [Piscirickettsia salmonis]ALA25965.1 transposase [Piscirickettsia salmonis]APS43428.1 hypothetical protein AVI48_02935 [Piscirickettsia salmonis]APS46780.1 hypothetical protein AVI49_03545 [Piscirickettsia salmonis]APS50753.1 hypothetical protein AVI50_07805 [Piscirickettsia salmonis]APS53959.1 hypothetical protein AVI51_07720 [Piscirickettsia salmonis]